MPKYNRAKPLLPWCSARTDGNEKRFIQIGNSMLLSDAVKALDGSRYKLLFSMIMEAGGQRRVTFPQGSAAKYGIDGATFKRAKQDLIQAGFIVEVEDEERSRFKAKTFEFSNQWKTKDSEI